MFDRVLNTPLMSTSKVIWFSKYIFFLQNDLYNERKSKIKYIQQCPNLYFVTKKGNRETAVNKITKQNNLK